MTSILIVDDHSGMRAVLREHFASRGYEICAEAVTGAAALVAAARFRPDGIVLDYHLPDADGASLVAGLRSAAPSSRIAMFSGDPFARRAASDAGIDGFVVKGDPLVELDLILNHGRTTSDDVA